MRCYGDESKMLSAWSVLIKEVDPDILTGYNIINFDIPYLLNRAAALKLSHFPYLGRTQEKTTMTNTTFQSRAYGKRENKSIKMSGRVQFDVLQVLYVYKWIPVIRTIFWVMVLSIRIEKVWL